jgi:NADP-dependent 3-hydroxy acid dehydrogenase YdfG
MSERSGLALVTGASSGIGRETAVKLADRGFKVLTAARRMDRLQELAEQHNGMVPMQVDLADAADTERFCKLITRQNEPVSVLVNNAGYSTRGSVEDVPLEQVRRVFEVNLFSLLQVTKACLPAMRAKRSGTIVNLSSVVGKFTYPLGGIYAATKYAVEAVTDALRLELGPLGIRVIAIRPGTIGTEFNDRANQVAGDYAAQANEEYQKEGQAIGASLGSIFKDLTVPGPELIADLIMDAISSQSPKAAYAAGPFSDDWLAQRFVLDDDAFHDFISAKLGLKDLKL